MTLVLVFACYAACGWITFLVSRFADLLLCQECEQTHDPGKRRAVYAALLWPLVFCAWLCRVLLDDDEEHDDHDHDFR